MHMRGVEKRQQKQPIAARLVTYSRLFHRIFTDPSTGCLADERLPARCSFATNDRRAPRAAGDLAGGASAAQTRPGIPASRSMPRLSANLSFLFNEVPFLDRFGAAARAGFRAVELGFAYDVQPEAIAARLAEHALECVLINAPPGDMDAGERGIASLPGRERDFAATIVEALRYARALGCPRIHVLSGVVPPGAGREQKAMRRSTLAGNLRAACAEASGQGVTLLVEALNPRDTPHYLFSTQAEAHAIRDEVGAANLKVQMDFYHTQIVEGDIAAKLERWLPHIGHIQIAGVPGRHEPDIGEINYAWLLRHVDEVGYDGWIGCEYRPLRDTLSGLAWRERLDVQTAAISRCEGG